jgi:hypothetical protein
MPLDDLIGIGGVGRIVFKAAGLADGLSLALLSGFGAIGNRLVIRSLDGGSMCSSHVPSPVLAAKPQP